MSNDSYITIDKDFSDRSRKVKYINEGTFGSVSICETPVGTYVSKETKLDNKSIGYPPDFITEIDALIKFRKLPSIIKLYGVVFDEDKKKGHLLLEILSCNLSEWYHKTGFSERIAILPTIIKQIGATLAILHAFQFVHNDMKSNNILVETTGSTPKFKLSDFGKAVRVRDEENNIYGGIEKYRPPRHRNIYESEYWALMVICTEIVLGSRFVDHAPGEKEDDPDHVRKFYWRNTDRTGQFDIHRYLKSKLSTVEYAAIPQIYWDFVNPILYERVPRIGTVIRKIVGENGKRSPIFGSSDPQRTEVDSFSNLGGLISKSLLDSISNDVSKAVEPQSQFLEIKDDFKMLFSKMNLYDYFTKFTRLFNKFLYSVSETGALNRSTLLCYAEVAMIIVLKSKVKHFTYFSSEREFLLYERAFLSKLQFQTVII